MRKATLGEDSDGNQVVIFACPGCKENHQIWVPMWNWNNSLETPTFEPSVLVEGGNEDGKTICHSFVTMGSIRFLEDSTHELAGKTVELPTWPDENEEEENE